MIFQFLFVRKNFTKSRKAFLFCYDFKSVFYINNQKNKQATKPA